MAKTYEAGLRLLGKKVKKYSGKYQPQLQAHLTTPQYNAFVTFYNAVIALLAELGEPTPNP